jgi:hypothetical protein
MVLEGIYERTSAPTVAELWQQTAHALLFQFQGDPGTLVGPRARAILTFLLAVVAVFGVLRLRSRPESASIIVAASVLPLLLLGLLTIHTPVWLDRYLLIATPAFTLILAIGLADSWSWPLGRAIASGVLILGFFQLCDLQNSSRRADWRPLIARISSAPHDIFLVAAHQHQVFEINFEWQRQHLPGEPAFATLGIGGQPRSDAAYLLLREPNSIGLRGLAAGFDRRDWQQWLERMGVNDIDFTAEATASQQVGAEYWPPR